MVLGQMLRKVLLGFVRVLASYRLDCPNVEPATLCLKVDFSKPSRDFMAGRIQFADARHESAKHRGGLILVIHLEFSYVVMQA